MGGAGSCWRPRGPRPLAGSPFLRLQSQRQQAGSSCPIPLALFPSGRLRLSRARREYGRMWWTGATWIPQATPPSEGPYPDPHPKRDSSEPKRGDTCHGPMHWCRGLRQVRFNISFVVPTEEEGHCPPSVLKVQPREVSHTSKVTQPGSGFLQLSALSRRLCGGWRT